MNPSCSRLRIIFFSTMFSLFGGLMAQPFATLPEWEGRGMKSMDQDWLVYPSEQKAGVYKTPDGKSIVLFNGLLRRRFLIDPGIACVDFYNPLTGQQLVRAVRPEAKVTINGRILRVGGLTGQQEHAYLTPEAIHSLKPDTGALTLKSYDVSRREGEQVKYKSWSPLKQTTGSVQLTFRFHAPSEFPGLAIEVHYRLYDGAPLLEKWMTVRNNGSMPLTLATPTHEVLALVEEESAVVGSPEQMKKQHGLYVETNYAFNNAMRYDISDQTTHWKTDSLYTSQVNYNYQTPCVLEVYPEKVTGVRLGSGELFTSPRTCELLMDGYDRERRGLAIRRMYRIVAPWTTQNPIFMHLVSRNDTEVRTAIDQCVATGYEALILSFGSHLNVEDSSSDNIRRWKSLADYAHIRGIRIGGYSLFSSRRISDADDVIDPVTGKPNTAAFFGHAPCMGSHWGLAYLEKLKYFFTETGFDIFENDGPYPGDVCASTSHPGHEGLHDSQWRQMELQKGLYRWMREQDIYINAPDWYFLDGTNKIAIGYRETNFSLPRDRQRILNRQNIYDGTWEKNPSMGWGFVPLVRYQGGGPEAVLEPLSEHLRDYEQLMMQYYGAGVQACYRGPRLFDTDSTRSLVLRVIGWYKKYRQILNADIIHLRRADGRDWDGFLHVDPQGPVSGLMMLFNPLKQPIERTIEVPLHYAGIRGTAQVSESGVAPRRLKLSDQGSIRLQVSLPPESYAWYVIGK
jgi:hypothetical protein